MYTYMHACIFLVLHIWNDLHIQICVYIYTQYYTFQDDIYDIIPTDEVPVPSYPDHLTGTGGRIYSAPWVSFFSRYPFR